MAADLKALAEAAKIRGESSLAFRLFRDACTPEAITNLYRERDEAVARERAAMDREGHLRSLALVEPVGSASPATWKARAEAAETALAVAKKENERLRAAVKSLTGDHEVRPMPEERLERILDFVEHVRAVGGGHDATLQWSDQLALIDEAVLAYRAREASASLHPKTEDTNNGRQHSPLAQR